MIALLDYALQRDVPVSPVLVLSDGKAAGLNAAKERGVDTVIFDRKDYDSKSDHEAAITEAVTSHDVDIIALAGYMRLLSADFCKQFENRIINIHPFLVTSS